jgi:hypothetical protein
MLARRARTLEELAAPAAAEGGLEGRDGE